MTTIVLCLLLAYAAYLSTQREHQPIQAWIPASIPLLSYRTFFTSLDGRDCPSWPVCSAYAAQAIQHYGVGLGSWLMLDRLIHEHDDVRSAPHVLIADEARVYDPLHNNTHWMEE
ncbi:MAG: membrane protein insertion efficiency factor YidD [Mariprofundaceae bacterium]|nr:membrane protein insertion efficiency factor YidD [Mariprofundaceae bacterium]